MLNIALLQIEPTTTAFTVICYCVTAVSIFNFYNYFAQVSAAISQTLQNLNTNSENLQTPFSEADLANMFNNFNIGEGNQVFKIFFSLILFLVNIVSS